MLDERFIILGALINFIGSIGYVRSTLKGDAKPNRVTWTLWAAAPLIASGAQFSQGVGLIALTTFMAGFNPLMVLVASFISKKAEWKITKFDIICGTYSIFGLILWQITQIPNVAILFAIVADGLAAAPTIVKSYLYPKTENSIAFSASAISSSLALLTIKDWTFENYSFPLYLIIVCLILFSLIAFQLGPKIQKLFSKQNS